MSTGDTSFPQLVALACHDLRTPLATIHGFARTIPRLAARHQPTERYVELIAAASTQMAGMIEDLFMAARIESGRLNPERSESDTLTLARDSAAHLGGKAEVDGEGGIVVVDAERATHAIVAFARCALRHGGLDRIVLRASGSDVEIKPVTASAALVLSGAELRDLGVAVALMLVPALGGSTVLRDTAFVVSFAGISSLGQQSG